MQKKQANNGLYISLEDLSSFVSFGNWISKNYKDDGVRLKDLGAKNIKFALDEIIRSTYMSSLNDTDRGLFINAINEIIPNLNKIGDLKENE